MKQAKAIIAALIAAAFCALVLVACAGQAEQPQEEVDPVEAERNQLVSEVESAIGNDDYQSVTMDIAGSSNVAAKSDDGDGMGEAEGDEDASYYEEGNEEGYDSEDLDMENAQIAISAKCDRSGETVRMQTRVDEGERSFEFYVNGDKAIMVMDSQAANATIEQFKMPQYADILSLIRFQSADMSLFADTVQDIQKEEDEGSSVYKVVCDPVKFASANASANALSQLKKGTKLKSVEIEYRVNPEGLLTDMVVDIQGPELSSKYASKFYDYNATDVEDGPESTVSYKEMVTGESDEEEAGYEEDAEIDDGYYEEDYEEYDDSEE